MKAVRHTHPSTPEQWVEPTHEHEHEPQHGLPEELPRGERLLWQGAPAWKALAVEVFHVRKLALYFAIILLLRAAFVLADGGGLMGVLASWAWLVPMAAMALGILLALARLTAQTTIYTITDKRVVLRIGIVLTVTFNLPFSRIQAAGLMLRGSDGHGDIPMTLAPGERIAILQLWPHARPWHVARPEPALRCLPEAAAVGKLLAAAWSEARSLPAAAVSADAAARAGAEPSGASAATLPLAVTVPVPVRRTSDARPATGALAGGQAA